MALRIGMIGCSGHYGSALNLIANGDDLVLAAVAFAHPTEKVAVVRKHKAYTSHTKEYDTPEALLDEAELDAIIINPPYGLAGRYNTLAMQRGLPTYSEKPLATTFADLEALTAAAAATTAPLVAMYEMRRSGVVAAAADLVRRGGIGRPLVGYGQKSYKLNPSARPIWYRDNQLYGGTIPWVAIHALDWLRYIVGEKVKYVTASQYTDQTGDLLPIAIAGTILLEFANGGSAVVSFDYLRSQEADSHSDDRFRIAGTGGVVCGSFKERQLTYMQQGAGETVVDTPVPRSLFADLLDAITGKGEPPMSKDDALASTALALWAREAALTNQRIALP